MSRTELPDHPTIPELPARAEEGQRITKAPFGHAVARLAEQRPDIVGLSADVRLHLLRDTDITQGKPDEARKAAMTADIPMRRIGSVEDVADVIAFLALSPVARPVRR